MNKIKKTQKTQTLHTENKRVDARGKVGEIDKGIKSTLILMNAEKYIELLNYYIVYLKLTLTLYVNFT